MTQRFAHMSPLLWVLRAAILLLGLVTLTLGIHGILNARQGGGSPMTIPLTALMISLLALYLAIARRRTKELEGRA